MGRFKCKCLAVTVTFGLLCMIYIVFVYSQTSLFLLSLSASNNNEIVIHVKSSYPPKPVNRHTPQYSVSPNNHTNTLDWNSTTEAKSSNSDCSNLYIKTPGKTSMQSPQQSRCILEAIHSDHSSFPPRLATFKPRFPVDVHLQLLELLMVFTAEMTSHNLTYFLYSGSLLGSVRHHGFIPWDDDLDLFMNVKDKPKIKVGNKPRIKK